MKKIFWRRVLSGLTTVSLLVNSLLPYSIASIAHAQESTDLAVQETVISPETPLPTESPTISPLPDSTPATTAEPTPTPTPEISPTPTLEITLTPSPEATPSNLSPPTPTPTPEPSPTPDFTTELNTKPEDSKTGSARLKADFPKDLQTQRQNYVPGEVIVKYKQSKLNLKGILGSAQAFIFEKKYSLSKKDEIKGLNIQVFRSKKSTEELVKELILDPNVEYAQPNYIKRAFLIPNDTNFSSLWGLNNSGQIVNETPGSNNADIDAPEAWDLETSLQPDVVIAVLDSGVAYNHPDLVGNMWDGSSNCKDAVGNSIAGGCPNHGWDYKNSDNNPLDDLGHGTHISGTIAATANNNRGVVGVSIQNNNKIMAIKVMDAMGYVDTGSELLGIEFAKNNGAKVINASYGGSYFDSAEKEAIDAFPGLFIAPAGNGTNGNGVGKDNDSGGHIYPCDYDSANIVCVAATDQDDGLPSFSNYGATSVDVGAPGVNIYSTRADSNLINETFESVTPPNIPSGWVKGGTNNKWATYNFGSNKVLYGQVPSFPYDNDTDSTVTSPNYNLGGGTTGATFSFITKCDTEYTTEYWYDYMALEVSSDGTVFTEILRWDEAFLDMLNGDANQSGGAEYYFENLPIPSQYLTDSFKFQYRWKTDFSVNNYDGCRLDNVNITKVTDGSDENYKYDRGTSMAAPHVAGLAALIWGYKPNLTSAQVKDRILQTGDPLTSLEGKTVTEKRINAYNALQSLTAPTAPGTPSTASPTNDTTPTWSWTAASDSEGIDHYVFYWDTVSGGEAYYSESLTSSTLSFTHSSPLASGTWYAKVRAFDPSGNSTDSAVGTVVIDADLPVGSITINNGASYTNSNLVTLNFSEVSLDVVLMKLGNGESEDYQNSIPYENPHAYTLPNNVDGTYTVRVRFIDAVGNESVGVISDNIILDKTNPTDPVDIHSTSHTAAPIANKTIDMAWTVAGAVPGATDEGSGIDGYSHSFTQGADDVPDATKDAEEIAISTSSSVLTDGSWYFHLRTIDNAGNWTSTVHAGPFVVDTTKPIIASHENISIQATSEFGAVATYTSPLATDNIDATGPASCSPVSGSTFPIGETTVLCDKTDTAGNSADQTTFIITVVPNNPPYFDPVANQVVNEDSSLVSIVITNITSGSGSESGQTVSLSATSSNTGLIPNPVVSAVSGGTATLTYTPVADAYGTATITVLANDGWVYNNTFARTFDITVNFVNDAPAANPDIASVNEDEILTIAKSTLLANDTDIEGNTLTVSSVSNFVHGSAVIEGDNIIFTPTANYFGSAGFDYTISDGYLTDTATVSITVNSVNDIPVAESQVVTTDEDTAIEIILSGSDIDGDLLSYTIISGPSNGTLGGVFDVNHVTYTPNANYAGDDSFMFRVEDTTLGPTGFGLFRNAPFARDSNLFEMFGLGSFMLLSAPSDTATITITVNPMNDAPVITTSAPDTATEDIAYVYDADATDPDGPGATWAVTGSDTCGGTIDPASGVYTFTPAGPVSPASCVLSVRVSDGGTPNLSDIQTATISINPVNDAPVAVPNSYITDEDTTLDIAEPGILVNDSDADNPTFSAVLVTGVSHGTLTLNSNGSFIYNPELNYNGSDSFTYKVNDGFADSNIATVSLTVTAVNDAPTAVPDTASVDEDTSLTIAKSALLVNDTDVDNVSLTLTGVSNPTNGNVSISSDNIVFTPTLNYSGPASFDYTISDGSLTDTGTVSITVNSINDAPSFGPISNQAVDEDSLSQDIFITNVSPGPGNESSQTVTFAATSSDPVIVPNPAVTGSGSTRTLTYMPSTNQFGAVTITVSADDGQALNNIFSRTFTITVNPINDAPVANPDTASVNEDQLLSIAKSTLLANDTDVDGDPLNIISVSNPINGSESIEGADVNFIPDADFNGTASFEYLVSDDALTDTAVVTITVNPINDIPVADSQAVTVEEDSSNTITLSGSDVDGDSLIFSITSGPLHGSLGEVSDDQVAYNPNADFTGSDSFEFTVNDGHVDSSPALVTITVTPFNDPPVLSSIGNFSINELEELAFTANASDPEGATLIYSLNGNPGGATINSSSGIFSWTPTESQGPGDYTFSVIVSDGVKTDSEEIIVTVDEVNQAPTAENISVSTNEDTDKAISLSANDADLPANILAYSILSGPSHGAVSLSGNEATYTPELNYNGADSFTYKANDGALNSNTATVSLTITPVNDAPMTTDDTYSTNEDTILAIAPSSLLDNDIDVDGNSLTAIKVTDPSHGDLTLNPDGSFTYTPFDNWYGTDTFTYKANDGTADGNIATVTIAVSTVNDAPVCSDVDLATDEDTEGSTEPNCTDVEGDGLTYQIVTQPNNGTASLGSLIYNPDENFNGMDEFTYKAIDAFGAESNVSFVNVTIEAVNDAPVAENDSDSDEFVTDEDGYLEIDADELLDNDTDVDEDPLSVIDVSNPINGTVEMDNNNIIFTPTANYFGPAGFDYTVTDGDLTDTATVSVIVNSVNDAPVANDGVATTSQEVPVTIDLSASDIDGDPLTYSIDTDVSNGTLGAISDNHVIYTPDSNYVGSDSFTFKTNDGTVDSNIATISITVNPPPVISSEANNTPSETSVTITWATDHPSTSRVIYDTVSHAILDVAPNYGYANSTVETDTSPKVTLHSVTINGLVAGTTYFYRVVSHGSPEVVGDENTFTTKDVTVSGGEVAAASTTSSTSSVCSDQKPGSAPTLISIISSGLNEVTLTWAKAKDPVTYYLIAFGTKPGEMLYGNPFVGGKDTTSYTVKGLSSGTRYYFRVRAGNNCMPGDFSNELSAVAYGEALTEIPEGFSPGVLGEEATTTEEVLGEETASPTPEISPVPQGGRSRRNIILAGIGVILLAAGYFFFIRRKRE